MSSTHPDVLAEVADVAGTPIRKSRRSFTNELKTKALERFYELESDVRCPCPLKQVTIELFGADNYKKRKSYVSKWLKKADQFSVVRKDLRKAFAEGGRGAAFPDEEDELYVRVLCRRMIHGYPVNHFWLQLEFRKILEDSRPPGYQRCKYSWGWAVTFCRRYRLSTQAKTNGKAHDLADRVEAIRNFHRWWLVTVQHSDPQTCPKYGRFDSLHILHIDQVPLPFAALRTRTLNPINSKSCRIATPTAGGLQKRQATVQLWICADENCQYVRPTIIFRGTTGPRSRLPTADERVLYESLPHIRVTFQKKAWADEDFCIKDILNVAADMEEADVHGEVCIGMDNHSAQRTPEILSLYEELGLLPLFTPANCTDCTSPVDHHVGRFIQTHMRLSYLAEIEKNPHIWFAAESDDISIEDEGSASAKARRMLMAQWFQDAWLDLTLNNKHIIKKAFVDTGFLLAKDGSEDHLLKLQGWSSSEPYRFR